MLVSLSTKQRLLHGCVGKGPRTLAEELRDIGEEFIEFLEQGLQALEGSAPQRRQRAPGSSTADSSSASSTNETTARCEALAPIVLVLHFVCEFTDERSSSNATPVAGEPKRVQKHKLVGLRRRQLSRQSKHSFKLSNERHLPRMKSRQCCRK